MLFYANPVVVENNQNANEIAAAAIETPLIGRLRINCATNNAPRDAWPKINDGIGKPLTDWVWGFQERMNEKVSVANYDLNETQTDFDNYGMTSH